MGGAEAVEVYWQGTATCAGRGALKLAIWIQLSLGWLVLRHLNKRA